MLNKLAIRNACRLWRDYLTYFLSLCMITALMFSFHSLIFSEDIYKLIHYGESGELSTAGMMLITFMFIATVIILLVVAWMINYMTRFILEKRSREFATYLLCGMGKSQISYLYIKENLFLGMAALTAGLLAGAGLHQVLLCIFYRSIGRNYQVSANLSGSSILLTIVLFVLCFAVALWRNKKQFSRMQIIQLINMDRNNEIVNEKRNYLWMGLFIFSVVNLCFLCLTIVKGRMTKTTAIFEMFELVFTFYCFYIGLASCLMLYTKKKGKLIYKQENIFLIRQFSSKIKNMCFTLGTISLLFMFAITGSALAFMLNDYQNKQLSEEYPFDIIMISNDTAETFDAQEELIEDRTDVQDVYKYCVYYDRTSSVRNFLYQNLRIFTEEADPEMARVKLGIDYYDYDVYMGVTDYNYLRKMLGLEPVILQKGQYLIHMPNRVYRELASKDVRLEKCLHNNLIFAGYKTEGFAQAGHNGADYLIIVPDEMTAGMDKYFALMAVMAQGEVPEDLSEALYELSGKTRGFDEINDYIRIGSEELFLTPATIQVRSHEVLELRFLMSTLSFPLFYIGLVFLWVSLTILSVWQLSDSNKYRLRYRILYQIGVSHKGMKGLVAKQCVLYYLCPVIFSIIPSAIIILYVGKQFVMYTGIHTEWYRYFFTSVVSFGGIYILYFLLTYFQFLRNIDEHDR